MSRGEDGHCGEEPGKNFVTATARPAATYEESADSRPPRSSATEPVAHPVSHPPEPLDLLPPEMPSKAAVEALAADLPRVRRLLREWRGEQSRQVQALERRLDDIHRRLMRLEHPRTPNTPAAGAPQHNKEEDAR